MMAEENMRDRDYPRTYKVDRANRRFVHGFGIFLVTFFLAGTPLHLLGVMKHPLSLSQLTLIDISVVAFVVWASLRVERRVPFSRNSAAWQAKAIGKFLFFTGH